MGNFTNIAHDDHGLSDEHVEVVMSHPVVAEVAHGEFVRVVVPIPDGVPSLPCALYGPAVGDGPVPESAVREVVRGNRGGPSRMIGLPSRPARNMVIIGIRGGSLLHGIRNPSQRAVPHGAMGRGAQGHPRG